MFSMGMEEDTVSRQMKKTMSYIFEHYKQNFGLVFGRCPLQIIAGLS
jgi:hypothetical protein